MLQRPDPTAPTGYRDVGPIWGSLEFAPSPGSETVQGGAPLATGQYRIRTWYRTDVRAGWQLTEGETSKVFQISSYGDPTGRRQELHLAVTTEQ